MDGDCQSGAHPGAQGREGHAKPQRPEASDPMIVAVRSILIAAPAVSALVGTRVYPGILPQDPVYPAVVLNVIAAVDAVTQDGKSGDRKCVWSGKGGWGRVDLGARRALK